MYKVVCTKLWIDKREYQYVVRVNFDASPLTLGPEIKSLIINCFLFYPSRVIIGAREEKSEKYVSKSPSSDYVDYKILRWIYLESENE